MKASLLLLACAAFASATQCKPKKTVVEIMTRGKLIEIAEDIEKIIENGLQPDDIVKFTPKFEKLIPDMIEEALVLLPVAKEMVEPGLKDYVAEREQKVYSGVNNFKAALPQIRKEGYPIVQSGVLVPRLKITQDQFQRGLDNIESKLKHVNFSNC